MTTRRYSGCVKVVCRFRDEADDYDCEVYVGGKSAGHVFVGLPRAWASMPEYRNGVDSDEVFDDVARTALGFAMADDPETGEEALIDSGDVDWDEEGIAVSRHPRTAAPDSQESLDFGRWKP